MHALHSHIGMAIQARPNLTLMGWVLPGPIKNRIGYGFKTKNRSGFGSSLGFIKARPEPDPVTYKMT